MVTIPLENYLTIHTKVKRIPPLWFSSTPRFLYPRRMNTDVYRKTCSCMFIAASSTENKPNTHQQQKRWTVKYSYNGTLHKKREGERREKETTNTHNTTCPELCCKGKIQSQVQWLHILCFMEEIGCPVGVCVCVCVCESLSRIRLFVIPWTIAHKPLLSLEFSRQEYWSGLPCPSPGDFPNPGIKPRSPALQADSLLSEPPGNNI